MRLFNFDRHLAAACFAILLSGIATVVSSAESSAGRSDPDSDLAHTRLETIGSSSATLRNVAVDVPAEVKSNRSTMSKDLLPPDRASMSSATPVGLKNASIFHPIRMMRPFFFGAVDEVHGFHAELDDLKESLTTLNAPISDLGTPIDGLKLRVNNLSTTVGDLHAPLDRMQAPLNGIERQMIELTKPLDSFQHSLRSIDHDMSELRQPIASMNEPLRALTTSTQKIGAPISKMSDDIENLTLPLNRIAQPLNAVAAPLNSLKQPLQSINDHMQSLSERMSGLEKELESFRHSIDALTRNIALAIVGGAIFIGIAIFASRPRKAVK